MIKKGYIELSLMVLFTIFVSTFSVAYRTYEEDEDETTASAYNSDKPLDSLIVALYNEKIMGSYEDYINDFILLDSVQLQSEEGLSKDTIYKKRLEMMASVVKLPYNNIVRNYIDTYTRPNSSMSTILGRALYYMPYFEKELNAQGLPLELKILPIIESALNPAATSRSGAGGLWQFTYATGKLYGLRLNSFIDERYDPIVSTRAACKLLKTLYNIYEDWTLVLAAYNCGSGNVNKALKRAPEAKNYWDIYHLLPTETRGFVPAFIGATYAYAFHKAHNLTPVMPKHPIIADTVMITNRMLHFNQITSTIDLPIETLRALNPMYKMDIVPAVNGSLHLILPMDNVMQFIEKESDIYAKTDAYLKDYTGAENLKESEGGYIEYKVKSGDVLGLIAKKHNVSVNNILKWNNIKDARKILIGQKLKIYK